MDPFSILARAQWLTSPESLRAPAGIRWAFAGKSGLSAEPHHLRQVHGVALIAASNITTPGATDATRPEGDGLFSTRPGTIVGVRTADCLPVLFGAEEGVIAVHAGWRGLQQGILLRTIAELKRLRADLAAVEVALGPSILPSQFEIGPEVLQAFSKSPHSLSPAAFAHCFMKGHDDRWHMDLQSFALQQLVSQGIVPERIQVIRSCTFTEKNLWFSFRREKQRTGSNWSWVVREAFSTTSR